MDNNFPVDTTSENIEPKASKKKKLSFLNLSLIILVLIIIGGFGFYLLKGGSFISGNKGTPETIESSSESSVSEKSPFSSLVGEDTVDDEILTEEELLRHSDPVMRFLIRNRFFGTVDGSSLETNLVLEEGEAILLVKKNEDIISYKIVSSKNEFLGYENKELTEFNPKVNPENLYVYDKTTGVYTRSDTLDFEYKLPDNLSDGDYIFLVCKFNDCKDNDLSWALVF